MIIRTHVKCNTCATPIVLRTTIGHGDYQEFAFPYPKCGIEIRFGMTINHDNVSAEYSKMENVAIFNDSSWPDITLTFDAEMLVKINPEPHPDFGTIYSPFINTVSLAEDAIGYLADHKTRLLLCKHCWPIIKNCKIHFDNKHVTLYNKEFSKLDSSINITNEGALISHFISQLDRFATAFCPNSESKIKNIIDRMNAAMSISSDCCKQLYNYFDGIDWINRLFEELFVLRNQWADIYIIIQPIYLIFAWNSEKNNLEDYTISQKRFMDIKQFFIDMYETLCRISVIAGGVEGIILEQQLVVPKKNGSMDLDKYRILNNGNKKDIIPNWSIYSVFKEIENNQLRNGIGHHAAHYDVLNDEVEYIVENTSGIQTHKIKYVLFCEKLIRLYYSLELASSYVHWLMLMKYGKT